MAIQTFPAASAGKTMFRTTLTSGTSYTVPAGVTYLNVTLMGGGGAGSRGKQFAEGSYSTSAGYPGQIVSSTLAVTGGASIAYAIGAGGTPANPNGGTGGTTTFTGATSAVGGAGGVGGSTSSAANAGTAATFATNFGLPSNIESAAAGTGGAGCIYIEYWA